MGRKGARGLRNEEEEEEERDGGGDSGTNK